MGLCEQNCYFAGQPAYGVNVLCGNCINCLRSRAEQAERERDAVIRTIQRYQPGGSPPPGDGQVLALWILGTLANEHDAQMLRVKACEEIAVGTENWERVANTCPSTAAVASLRRAYEATPKERDEARAKVERLRAAARALCKTVTRYDNNTTFESWAVNLKLVLAKRDALRAALEDK